MCVCLVLHFGLGLGRWGSFSYGSAIGLSMELLRAEQSQRKRPKHWWEDSRAGPQLRTLIQVVATSGPRLGRSEHLLASVSEEETARPENEARLPIIPYAARRAKFLDWPDEQDDMKRRALHIVRVMLESDFGASKLGGLIYELSGVLEKEHQIQRSIELTFAKKAAATLLKRALSMWKLFKWHARSGYVLGLRITEQSLFDYLEDVKNNAAPTSLQATLEAVAFFHSLLGLTFQLDAVISHRVRGLAHTALLQKRPLKQARALLAQEVLWLEEVVCTSLDTAVVCVAGFLLYVLSNCARWGDAQASTLPELDETGERCILTSDTTRHKLSTTAQRKTTLLPFAAFGRLLHTAAWAEKWLSAMKRARLPRQGADYLLPSWNESTGTFLRRRMTSGEGSLHLREVLRQKGGPVQLPLPSSHSLKATQLSWMAKAGTFSLSERQILGHHLDRPSVSALTYGRQNFIGPLQKLRELLSNVVAGKFRPDDSASALVSRQIQDEELAADECEVALHGVAHRPDDSASEDLADDELQGSVGHVVPQAERRHIRAPDPLIYRQHSSSGTLHVLAAGGHKFLCGRPVTANYVAPATQSVAGAPLCFPCQKGQSSS